MSMRGSMRDTWLKIFPDAHRHGIRCCFVTFTDSEDKKVAGIESEKHVAAILAFGNPERARKKMHVNLLTMAGISFREKQQYFAPKKGALDLAYLDKFGNKDHVDEQIDFYGDIYGIHSLRLPIPRVT